MEPSLTEDHGRRSCETWATGTMRPDEDRLLLEGWPGEDPGSPKWVMDRLPVFLGRGGGVGWDSSGRFSLGLLVRLIA